MKKTILLFCISALSLGCNNENKNQPAPEPGHAVQHGSTKVTGEKTVVVLNDGKKWQADSSTNAHVATLSKITVEFDAKKVKNKEAYLSLSQDLQTEIEYLVKGCRMKGSDHDALHQWLEPLMQMVKKLAGVSTKEEGALAYEEIDQQVKMYPKYFE